MSATGFQALADLMVLAHFAFAAFVLLGGLLVLRWPRLVWVHLPAACWGVLIEFAGWICPLTPLENSLRVRGGGAGYAGDFLNHYVTAVLYPEGLTRTVQIGLGSLALLINLLLYWQVAKRRRRPALSRAGSGA